MKTVRDLNWGELLELKERYLDSYLAEVEGRGASDYELADVDRIVSDEDVFRYYEDVVFEEEDFACNLWMFL